MVVIELSYGSGLVLNHEQALQLMSILENAEAYEQKYLTAEQKAAAGLPDSVEYTHHVYPNERQFSMRVIGKDLYHMAKLAGKPAK